MLRFKFFRFSVAGGIATTISYFTFPAIYEYLFYKRLIESYLVSTILNITVSFFLQKYFVFRSTKKIFHEYLLFFSGAMGLVVLSYLLLQYLIYELRLESFYANAIAVTLTAAVSFIYHSKLTFGGNN